MADSYFEQDSIICVFASLYEALSVCPIFAPTVGLSNHCITPSTLQNERFLTIFPCVTDPRMDCFSTFCSMRYGPLDGPMDEVISHKVVCLQLKSQKTLDGWPFNQQTKRVIDLVDPFCHCPTTRNKRCHKSGFVQSLVSSCKHANLWPAMFVYLFVCLSETLSFFHRFMSL